MSKIMSCVHPGDRQLRVVISTPNRQGAADVLPKVFFLASIYEINLA